jgi:hypothetical protein
MRFTIAAEANRVVLGRTRHFFVFSQVGGGWTIDSGRFVVYAFLIAMLTLAVLGLEWWIRTERARRA